MSPSNHGYSTITLQNSIHADIHNSVFENNTALMGGVINAKDQGHLTFTNCTFSKNKAVGVKGGAGGAIYAVKQVQLFLSSCKFEANFADDSGGVVRVLLM